MVKASGAAFLDVTMDLARVRNPFSIFYRIDGHPNADGHALIAKEVLAAVRKSHVLDRCEETP